MFELLNNLFIRSNDDDDDEYDDYDNDDDGVNEEEGGEEEEEESDAAATIIAQANGAGGGGEAAVAQSTETTTTTATVAVIVKEEEDDDDDEDELETKDVDDDGNSCCEESDGHGDAEDDEWNGLFQEFKTGMFSLTSSVSAVSAVAAEALTGALEEAQTSLTTTTSLIMSAGAGRPPFVLSAAEEDDGDVYYYEDDGDEMVATKSGSLEDGFNDHGEGIEDHEDEEVNFLEAPRISNEENDPRRYKTLPNLLESLDIVKMRQRLMSAEEKRNTLMQMVDARNEEICMLRFELDQCTQRRLRRQSDLESNIAFTGTSCSSDDRIQWLKRETQWWRHLISSNTNDASMKALSTTISQLRDDLRHSNANGYSVRETIKASENVIRDLRLRIQTIKDNTKK